MLWFGSVVFVSSSASFLLCTVHCDCDLKEEIGDSKRGIRGISSRCSVFVGHRHSVVEFSRGVQSKEERKVMMMTRKREEFATP